MAHLVDRFPHIDNVSRTLLEQALQAAAQGPKERQQQSAPLHLWQIRDFLVCPIIGTCLSLDEQKKILLKSGISLKNLDAYDIHCAVVQRSGGQNPVSVRTENMLNRKYQREIETFNSLSEDELCREWHARFGNGEHDALLWCIAARPGITENTIRMMFADIHMQMHELSAQNRHVRRARQRLEEENARLAAQLTQIRDAYRAANKQARQLENELAGSRARCAALERARSEAASRPEPCPQRSDAHAALKQENRLLYGEIAGLAETIERLQRTCDELKAQKALLKSSRACPACDALSGCAGAAECPAAGDCPACDLCRLRVLVVGGLTKMEHFYRRVVETCNGTFEYHDGYMQSGSAELENKIRRADLVLCPVTCNSHGACLLVKRVGRKYNKTVNMLPGSSLSSIGQSLRRHASGPKPTISNPFKERTDHGKRTQ